MNLRFVSMKHCIVYAASLQNSVDPLTHDPVGERHLRARIPLISD
jgi:hypothetical protein